MVFSLLWLPAVLREAGLKVAPVDGWESRGLGQMAKIAGVMCHHTATQSHDRNMPSLRTLINGHSKLRGPLAQLGLGRDGTFYVIAAGRCNHAGEGVWDGVSTGNSSFIAIEAENDGVRETWPPVQMDAYARGVVAILTHLGLGSDACVGHKEYALPSGRKIDPSFEMGDFRRKVAGLMLGSEKPSSLIPATEPGGKGRPTLRRGSTGVLVKMLQQKLGIVADGFFGPGTESEVRAFQRSRKLVPDGIVGPNTWPLLDGIA